MKKIVLIGFLSALCLNVFSQETSLDLIEEIEKRYENAKTTDEKLDVIFYDILEKQISDYKEMEAEKAKWHKKYKEIKQGNNNKRLEALQAEKINLDSEISNLRIIINEKIQDISKLERNKNDISELKRREKNRVEAEIEEIFKHQGLISEDLLKITKERALLYQVSPQLMFDLSAFIDVSKKIIQAQNLLSKRLNVAEVESQLIAIKNIRNNKFDFLNIKINSLTILLEKYCDKSQDLFEMFETVDSSGYTDEDLKDELKKQRSLFISFPFLFDEITKKIKDINYKSQLQECY
jgi:hypothetical protein